MHRRQCLVLAGVFLAGCASPDGDGAGGTAGPSTGPETLAFGETHTTEAGVEFTCRGVERTDAIEIDGETHPAPDDQVWLLVDVRAENATDEERELPWRQALSVRIDDQEFDHDVNDTPTSFLFWADGYRGGDPVDPSESAEGVVPVAVDPAYADMAPTVVLNPGPVPGLETAVHWRGD